MTKKALISVSDKAGIVEFAQELKKLGWDIISTGGTKVVLDNAGISSQLVVPRWPWIVLGWAPLPLMM